MDKISPVIQLLNLVWEQANTATGHSWERLNHAMQHALTLTIGAGFPWDSGDMAYVATHYRFGYWCRESPEWIYTAAVRATNLSAAKSYEAWKQRKPFLMDNVQYARAWSNPYRHGGGSSRGRDRLTLNASFAWYGHLVTVTSFAKDGLSLTACSYKPQPQGSSKAVIDRRFTITHADLAAERQARKERTALVAMLDTSAHEQGSRDAILAALGVTTQEALDRLPLTTLRKVAAQFAAPSMDAAASDD